MAAELCGYPAIVRRQKIAAARIEVYPTAGRYLGRSTPFMEGYCRSEDTGGTDYVGRYRDNASILLLPMFKRQSHKWLSTAFESCDFHSLSKDARDPSGTQGKRPGEIKS